MISKKINDKFRIKMQIYQASKHLQLKISLLPIEKKEKNSHLIF